MTPKPASPKHTITKQDQSETKEEWIENLKRYYDEKDVVERQILRLENDEKIIDLKKKFKEMTENKFQKLCIDNDNLEKVSFVILNQKNRNNKYYGYRIFKIFIHVIDILNIKYTCMFIYCLAIFLGCK